MAKKSEAAEAEVVSEIPADVLWEPHREITMYAVIPCRGGHRLLEMTTTTADGCAFGTLSESDVGDLVFSRAKRRMMKQAVQ